MAILASKELLELMNRGIARELQVSIQYMWQHVLVTGIKGAVAEGILKEIRYICQIIEQENSI